MNQRFPLRGWFWEVNHTAKQTKKEPACSVVEQAGVPIDRVTGGLRERVLIAHVWSMLNHAERKSARETRGHRTPRAEVGRADVGIKSRRNRRRKERHGMPHNERCRKADAVYSPNHLDGYEEREKSRAELMLRA